MKKIASLVVALAVAAALFGCGKKIPLAGDQKNFAGKWVADDGTFIIINLDGSGETRKANTCISGGRTAIRADSITIGYGPIKTRMRITEQPKMTGGTWSMVVDGIKHTRQQSYDRRDEAP